ncbi:MAG TPA: adenylate/guanylate cyclase domain-containing protein [Dongiaceae bacterium]|jgi:class 3 adenylate cyclase|nr:adenylate/guanylate cyclase domain-containing protein [Dongiaceae bacterium]
MTTLITQDRQTAKRRMRIPIWLVLVLVLGGMTSVMAVVIGVRFYVAGLVSTNQLVDDLGRASLAQLTETIGSQLQPASDQATFLADILSSDQVDPRSNQRLQDLLLGSLAAVRQLRAVAYVSLDHRVVWAGPNDNGRGYTAKVTQMADETQVPALLDEAQRRRSLFWSKPILFDWSTGPLLIAVAPVFRDTEVIGIIGAAVSSRTASDRLARLAGTSGLVPFVLTAEGRILMHGSTGTDVPPGRKWSDGAILPSRAEFPDPVLAAMPWPLDFNSFNDERNRAPDDFAVDGVELPTGNHILIYRLLNGYGPAPWIIGYHLPETWFDRTYGTINRAIPFALIVLVIALGLAFWLGRSIARPMIILSQSGQRLAKLDFTPLEIKSSRIREVQRAVESQHAMRNGLQWLSNYIPRSLTPLLMKSAGELISRERDIVVLFTDIVGFSQIAEGRAAAKVAALLNRHFALIGTVIDQEGGTIDKYIGDSIMAFWGAPLDQEDRAERAVRAAQRIAQKLHADNERRARKGLKPIRIRIGIHKGPALVGNIGAPGRVNYTLVGDTVNVAQRLEQFGRDIDDGVSDAVIAISEELALALPPGVALIDRGAQLFHGRSTAMRVFQVPME